MSQNLSFAAVVIGALRINSPSFVIGLGLNTCKHESIKLVNQTVYIIISLHGKFACFC